MVKCCCTIQSPSGFINSNYTTVLDSDEMILLSPNGNQLWNRSFPAEGGQYGNSRAEIARNGTIVLVHEYPVYLWESERIYQRYTESGTLIWTRNESYDVTIRTGSYFGCQVWGANIESMFKLNLGNDSNS